MWVPEPPEQPPPSLHLCCGVVELDHIQAVAVFCFVSEVISDGLLMRREEWVFPERLHFQPHARASRLLMGKRRGAVQASP